MTEKQKRVIQAARNTPGRFLEIQRVTRFTAHENTMARLEGQRDVLRTERCRLIRTWGGFKYLPGPHEV